jgi:hypothetical protein
VNNACRRVVKDGGVAFLVIALPLVVAFLALGDFMAALRTLSIASAVRSLTALVAFSRKPLRARSEDGAVLEHDSPAGAPPRTARPDHLDPPCIPR